MQPDARQILARLEALDGTPAGAACSDSTAEPAGPEPSEAPAEEPASIRPEQSVPTSDAVTTAARGAEVFGSGNLDEAFAAADTASTEPPDQHEDQYEEHRESEYAAEDETDAPAPPESVVPDPTPPRGAAVDPESGVSVRVAAPRGWRATPAPTFQAAAPLAPASAWPSRSPSGPSQAPAQARDGRAGDPSGLGVHVCLPPSSTYDAERCGTTIGRGTYTIEHVIGRGGMGTVFAAVHNWTGRAVAIKVLRRDVAATLDVARMLQEARAATSVDHPHVVEVLDMGRDPDGTVYLVFEFLEGETLAARLERTPASSIEEIATILLPILDALAVAHSRGIVHRDIKPENIFLEVDGQGGLRPKLLDFGLAKMDKSLASETQTGIVVGTPAYMSPERAQGKREAGPASDVWSMGVVLYECLTRELPFEAEHPMGVLLAIVTEPVPSLRSRPEVPAAVADLVDAMLTRDLAARIPNAGVLRDALAQATGVDVRATLSPGARHRSSIPASTTVRSARVRGHDPELERPDEHPLASRDVRGGPEAVDMDMHMDMDMRMDIDMDRDDIGANDANGSTSDPDRGPAAAADFATPSTDSVPSSTHATPLTDSTDSTDPTPSPRTKARAPGACPSVGGHSVRTPPFVTAGAATRRAAGAGRASGLVWPAVASAPAWGPPMPRHERFAAPAGAGVDLPPVFATGRGTSDLDASDGNRTHVHPGEAPIAAWGRAEPRRASRREPWEETVVPLAPAPSVPGVGVNLGGVSLRGLASSGAALVALAALAFVVMVGAMSEGVPRVGSPHAGRRANTAATATATAAAEATAVFAASGAGRTAGRELADESPGHEAPTSASERAPSPESTRESARTSTSIEVTNHAPIPASTVDAPRGARGARSPARATQVVTSTSHRTMGDLGVEPAPWLHSVAAVQAAAPTAPRVGGATATATAAPERRSAHGHHDSLSGGIERDAADSSRPVPEAGATMHGSSAEGAAPPPSSPPRGPNGAPILD